MRTTIQVLLTTLAMLVLPATASANFAHTVMPGESLYSVAATDGLSVSALAAANGLSTNSQLIAGSTLQIPPQTGDSAAAPAESTAALAPSVVSSSSGSGGYVVQPGDTLSGIAAADGISVDQLAAENGLDANGLLLAGAHLSVPGASVTSSQPVASPGGAQPTAESVSPADVAQVAADNGVSPSLADAIAEQESGFNNNEVSSTGAVGVMQIEPGTWQYIQHNLSGPLSPVSAQDNVRGGVLLLRSLLQQTGGDPGLAAAGYYQGLQSVREHGLYRDTRRYVADVSALQRRFGGP